LAFAIRRHVAGGGKAIGAAGNHAHADAGRFRIGDVFNVQVTRGEELVQVAADAHVAVAGAGLRGGRHGRIGQHLLVLHISGFQQFFRGDRPAKRGQQHGAKRRATDVKECTSFHSIVSKVHVEFFMAPGRDRPRFAAQLKAGSMPFGHFFGKRNITLHTRIVDADSSLIKSGKSLPGPYKKCPHHCPQSVRAARPRTLREST
jgi:hypothetical protein